MKKKSDAHHHRPKSDHHLKHQQRQNRHQPRHRSSGGRTFYGEEEQSESEDASVEEAHAAVEESSGGGSDPESENEQAHVVEDVDDGEQSGNDDGDEEEEQAHLANKSGRKTPYTRARSALADSRTNRNFYPKGGPRVEFDGRIKGEMKAPPQPVARVCGKCGEDHKTADHDAITRGRAASAGPSHKRSSSSARPRSASHSGRTPSQSGGKRTGGSRKPGYAKFVLGPVKEMRTPMLWTPPIDEVRNG